MANGRRPRRVGFEQNTALDTLERVLGLGQNIAQTVQANRQKRDNFNAQYLNSLTQGVSGITNNAELQQKLDSLMKFKQNRQGSISAESIEFFNIAEQNIKNQMSDNSDFDLKLESMNKKQKNAQDWVQMMYDYNNPDTSEKQREEMRQGMDDKTFRLTQEENFKQMMQGYSADKMGFYAKHNDRLDNFMMNNLVTTESYMTSILNNWKADGKIDEEEYNLYYNGIMTGNAQPLLAFEAKRQDLSTTLAKDSITSFTDIKKEFNALTNAIKFGSISSDMFKKYFSNEVIDVGDDTGSVALNDAQKQVLAAQQAFLYDELTQSNFQIKKLGYQDLMFDDDNLNVIDSDVAKILGVEEGETWKDFNARDLSITPKIDDPDKKEQEEQEEDKKLKDEQINRESVSFEEIENKLATPEAKSILKKSNNQINEAIKYIKETTFSFGQEMTDAEIKKLTKQFGVSPSEIKSINQPGVYKNSKAQFNSYTNKALNLIGKKGNVINKQDYKKIKKEYDKKINRLQELKSLINETNEVFKELQPYSYLNIESLKRNNPQAYNVLQNKTSYLEEERKLQSQVSEVSTIINGLDNYYDSSLPKGAKTFINNLERRYNRQKDRFLK